MTQELLLSPKNQRLTLTYGGTRYVLTFRWLNVELGGWVLDIATEDRRPIISGIPLVTGVDLLDPFRHRELGFSLIIASDVDVDIVPSFRTLGRSSRIYLVPNV